MTAVPNWIGNAVVLYSNAVVPVVHWRATKTQVVVQDKDGREWRYHLDGLREVGTRGNRWDTRTKLVAADDPRAKEVRLRKALDAARDEVLTAVEHQRLQDGTDDLDVVLTKLEAVRLATVKAQAMLSGLDDDV